MFCPKCGVELADDAKFCEKCGANVDGGNSGNSNELVNMVAKEAKNAFDSMKRATVSMSSEELKKYDATNDKKALESVFVDPDERLIASMGGGYLVNLLYHKVATCSALLTDRRIYLKGVFYHGDSKTLFRTTEEKILDLEDITGTGFIYTRFSKIMLFWGILSALCTIVIPAYASNAHGFFNPSSGIAPLIFFLVTTVLLLFRAFAARTAYFFIDYAGGRIKIDAKIIGLPSVQDFHKQIRRAKDKLWVRKNEILQIMWKTNR